MATIKDLNPDYRYLLWTDSGTTRVLPDMPSAVRKVYEQRMSEEAYAFAADILRIVVVHSYGGIYLDVDMEPVSGFETVPIDALNGLFHYNSDEDLTVPNDTIGLHSAHPLLDACLLDIAKGVGDFGPGWLGLRIREWCGLSSNSDHKTLGLALRARNIEYMYSYSGRTGDFWEAHFKHRGAYLWSKENQEKLRNAL